MRPESASPCPSMRTLVVEDDRPFREALVRRLAALGHDVVSCATGEQAWSEIGALRPEVVFTGWLSPHVDGPGLCRRIRAMDVEDSEYTYVVVTRGLDEVEQAVAGMDAGADDFLRRPLRGTELEARLIAARRVVSLHSRLRAQEHERQRLADQLVMAARTDPLTGLANRLRLDEDQVTMQGRMDRCGHQACIAVLDVDHFKRLNDAQGHAAGDAILRAIAGIMARTLRASDMAYRNDGAEFVCLFPEIDAVRGRSAADRIRHLVERAAMHHPGSPYGVITVSVGVASSAEHPGAAITELLGRAYNGLHAAKALGRNRVQVDLGAAASAAVAPAQPAVLR